MDSDSFKAWKKVTFSYYWRSFNPTCAKINLRDQMVNIIFVGKQQVLHFRILRQCTITRAILCVVKYVKIVVKFKVTGTKQSKDRVTVLLIYQCNWKWNFVTLFIHKYENEFLKILIEKYFQLTITGIPKVGSRCQFGTSILRNLIPKWEIKVVKFFFSSN